MIGSLMDETKLLREAISSISTDQISELKSDLSKASEDFNSLKESIASEASRGNEHFKCSADANGLRPECNVGLCCGRAEKDNS